MDYPRYVYAITHNRTGKVYVGSSKNVKVRYDNHIILLRNHKHPVEDLQADFDRFGEDFTFAVVDEISIHSDKFKEYEWMEKYQSYIRGKGYNYKDRHFAARLPERRSMYVTEHERALIELIRKSEDPTAALKVAVGIITDFLEGGSGDAHSKGC